jgi:hypothetical protein
MKPAMFMPFLAATAIATIMLWRRVPTPSEDSRIHSFGASGGFIMQVTHLLRVALGWDPTRKLLP